MANSNIPLVRSNSVNDINTSIIAIKKELKTNGETDINVNVDVNYDVANTVEEGNGKPVTSGAVYDYATPVDTVQDGNLKAVTSNAVFDLSSTNNPFIDTLSTSYDLYTCFDELPQGRVSNIRVIGQNIVHSPNGDIDCDFCYTVYKLNERNDFYSVIAYNVRSKLIYTISKVNGIWEEWQLISKINGLIPKNKTLRLIFNKPFVNIDGCVVVQGTGGVSVRINWYGGSNGLVQQIYENNGFMKITNLSGSISTLTYILGNGYIDIYNPNDETEAFEFTSNVRNYFVY